MVVLAVLLYNLVTLNHSGGVATDSGLVCADIVDLLSTGTRLLVREFISIHEVFAVLLSVHVPCHLQVVAGHDVKLQKQKSMDSA